MNLHEELVKAVLRHESAIINLSAEVAAMRPEPEEYTPGPEDWISLAKERAEEIACLRADLAAERERFNTLDAACGELAPRVEAIKAERDQLRADLAAEKSANEELHKRVAELEDQTCNAEELRQVKADLAALRARKVKLPKLVARGVLNQTESGWNQAIYAAHEAIRAAGVEVMP